MSVPLQKFKLRGLGKGKGCKPRRVCKQGHVENRVATHRSFNSQDKRRDEATGKGAISDRDVVTF